MGRHAAAHAAERVRRTTPRRRAPYALLTVAGLGMTVFGAIALTEGLADHETGRPDQSLTTQAPPDSATGSSAGQSTTPATSAASAGQTPASQPSSATDVPQAADQPVRLVIPSIGVNARVEEVVLTGAGELSAPTDTAAVGWYSGSSVPGQPGSSVLDGHLDTTTGPAVFMNLSHVKPGAAVTVVLNSGTAVAYDVTSVDSYPGTRFPASDVYGPQPDPELRLITCTGAFVGGRYLDNLVVSARLHPAGG